MKVSNRLTHDQFVDVVCEGGEHDLIDWQEEFVDELVETGSVRFTINGKKYMAVLTVDQVFWNE